MALSPETLMSEAEANMVESEGQGTKAPLFKFILTGGPCGGKTTAIARLSSFLRERGFEVIACAEVYTILASNGMSLDFYSTEGMDTVIQNSVLDVQLSLEDSIEKVLKARGKPAVLLCDRGPMGKFINSYLIIFVSIIKRFLFIFLYILSHDSFSFSLFQMVKHICLMKNGTIC